MRHARTPKRLRRHLFARKVDEHAQWKMRQPEFRAAIVARLVDDLIPNPPQWNGKGLFEVCEKAADIYIALFGGGAGVARS